MSAVWFLGDSNTLLMGDFFAAQVTPPPDWTVQSLGVGSQAAGPGLIHTVESVAQYGVPTIAVVCYGGVDAARQASLDHPTALPPPNPPLPFVTSRNPLAAGEIMSEIGMYLNGLGARTVLCRGVGTLTVPHPLEPAPLSDELYAFLAEMGDGYRIAAQVFANWPDQVNYHLTETDPSFWEPDHIHVSPKGCLTMGCGVHHWLTANAGW